MKIEHPKEWPIYYSEAYRHADTLIWQVPAWSTAVFAAVIPSLVFIHSSDGEGFMKAYGLSEKTLGQTLLAGALLFFGAVYYALFRMRAHQRYTQVENAPRPLLKRLGAPVIFQLVAGFESAAAIWLLLVSLGCPHFSGFLLLSFGLLFLTLCTEGLLGKHMQNADNLRASSRRNTCPGTPNTPKQSPMI